MAQPFIYIYPKYIYLMDTQFHALLFFIKF